MTASFTTQLVPVVMEYLVVPAIIALIGFLSAWLRSKTKHKNLQSALAMLNDAASTSVRHVEQTIRPFMHEVSRDGVITPEERAQLKAQAMMALRQYLGVHGAKHVQSAFQMDDDQMDRLMDGKIEAAVLDMKASKPVTFVEETPTSPQTVPPRPPMKTPAPRRPKR